MTWLTSQRSLSIKRAAIALGDQFGLSLYNKGQIDPLVIRTLVGVPEIQEDLQADIPQQVSLGNDEIDRGEEQVVPAHAEEPKGSIPEAFSKKLAEAKSMDDLNALWKEATEGGFHEAVRPGFTARKMEIG